jgi:hypothetical protein
MIEYRAQTRSTQIFHAAAFFRVAAPLCPPAAPPLHRPLNISLSPLQPSRHAGRRSHPHCHGSDLQRLPLERHRGEVQRPPCSILPLPPPSERARRFSLDGPCGAGAIEDAPGCEWSERGMPERGGMEESEKPRPIRQHAANDEAAVRLQNFGWLHRQQAKGRLRVFWRA